MTNFKDFISELDQSKLAYHDELNPKFWEGSPPNLKLEVKDRLLKIGLKFVETLNLPAEAISDYVLTGSNANFNWTSLSDLDLHLEINESKLIDCQNCFTDIESCIQAKKSLWNDRHDIVIYDHPVEVYAAIESNKIVGDSGTYSLLQDRWLVQPTRREVHLDEPLIVKKAAEIATEIDLVVDTNTNDQDVIIELVDKLWRMRQAGLERAGEFSTENLVFKALRNNGYIDKIRNYAVHAEDRTLSMESVTSYTNHFKLTS